MKRFAIIGVAGYIAPRHLQAIKETGNILVASMDKSDSVGILDQYFPESAFFTEFERFERYLEKLRSEGNGIDYLVVCTPNYLHDSHCRFGMKMGADVICEKPLVLNPHNLEGLKALEIETGKKVFTILQLRLHPELMALKSKMEAQPNHFHEVELRYITPRGAWYKYSWKGDEAKSGGIVTNIGIHLFDILCWLFGEYEKVEVQEKSEKKVKGIIRFKNANVNWFLSIDKKDLPEENLHSWRSLKIDGIDTAFDKGFQALHTTAYTKIMEGEGFGIEEVTRSISLVSSLKSLI